MQHDNEQSIDKMKASSKLIAYEVSKLFGGSSDDADDTGDAEVW